MISSQMRLTAKINKKLFLHNILQRSKAVFSGSKTGDFFQENPGLKNQFEDDQLLDKHLKSVLPDQIYKEVRPDLVNFGQRVATEVLAYHQDVSNYEPTLQQYSAWGERIDHIQTHPSWKKLHDVAAEEKLISIPYENKQGIWSRTLQVAKLYLFSPSSGLYSCPLAMTDGAASILKTRKENVFQQAYSHLTSNDPDLFWTSGQWMTEKKGGSDVGNATQTRAVRQSDGSYKLYGFKWFTSATDANMAMTLARIEDENGETKEGTKGLTMFYLETRDKEGRLNGIRMEKLKKKLGTRQMPTAEMILEGTKAYKVSKEGRGIASISPMLTVTRIHNSIMAVSNTRRLLNWSKDFARKRVAFGHKLIHNPLHVQTLARIQVELEGGFYMLMKVAHLFGLEENQVATDHELMLLRILTPLLKLYTGKQSVAASSELLESFGGHGYLEDTGLPQYLRDAQVLSIWEGTTNVLSMDVLRSITKTNGEVLRALLADCMSNIASVPSSSDHGLSATRQSIVQAINDISSFAKLSVTKDETFMMAAARDFSYSLARTYIASLLYGNVSRCPDDGRTTEVAIRWTLLNDLAPINKALDNERIYSKTDFKNDHAIIYS